MVSCIRSYLIQLANILLIFIFFYSISGSAVNAQAITDRTAVEEMVGIFDADLYPLRTVDTSTPQSTLRDFNEILNESHRNSHNILESYFASSRLFPSGQESELLHRKSFLREEVKEALDLSDLPPALVTDTNIQMLVLQLKEVHDRIVIQYPFY